MKKPVFCINRLRYFRTIIFAANAMFAVLCLLTVFPVADSTDRASAEVNGGEYSLTLGMNGNINFSINPTTVETQGGALNVARTTIIGSTNAPTGYQLFISSASDDNSFLLDGEDKNTVRDDSKMQPTTGTFLTPEALFTSQDTPATWGFAIPGVGSFDETYTTSNPDASAKFAAVPAAGNGQLIHETDAAVENDSVDIYYGTKVNSRLRHGKYSTWVKYSAVTDMASEIVDGISISPRRIRNNYEPGTTITITSETRIASDLGILIAQIDNQTCANIKKITDDPLVITCEIPDGLENGEYDVTLSIPQYGKTFTSADKLTIVDPYDIMQEIDREVYDSVLIEQQYQFIDSRDNKMYYITKLKNGNLYMTQNLDFELSTEGTTLSPDTSDVETEKVITRTELVKTSSSNDTVKYSYTQNHDETGRQLSSYNNNWSNSHIRGTGRETSSSEAHVVTIEGAAALQIDLYHSGESCCDYVRIFQGSHPAYTYNTSGYYYQTSMNEYSGSVSVNGNTLNNVGHDVIEIPGSTVTFAFGSDGSVVGNGYGYYAVITAAGSYEHINEIDRVFATRDDESNSADIDKHLLPGINYSITAAMAGSIENTDESICPKGWHLDNYADYKNTITGLYGNTSMGNGTISRMAAPLYILEGQYWGANYSTIEINANSLINTTSFNHDSMVEQIQTKGHVFGSVRCVFYAPQSYSIEFNANGGSNPPEEQFYGGWENSESHTFKITGSIPSREGSTFLGWSENPNATVGDYQPGSNFVATDRHTLYAIWSNTHNYFDDAFEAAGKTKTNGYYAMQDMTEEICAAVPKKVSEFEANETQLIDLRDNKIYFVSKLQDGKCWMTQNLNFSLDAAGTTLDPATSSVAHERTITAADFDAEHASYYQGFGNLMKNDFYGSVDITGIATSLNDPVFHYLLGSAYTYPAATALAGKNNAVFTSESSSSGQTVIVHHDDEQDEPDNFANLVTTGIPIVKYSHTSNIDDTGRKNTSYGNSWSNLQIRGTERTSASSNAHVVTIPGASSIKVEVYYNGESTSYDWVRIWRGSYPSYTADTSGGNVVASKLGGGCSGSYTVNGNSLTRMCKSTYTVAGDTVTFAFRSDGSGVGQGYGYYAIVKDVNYGVSHYEDQGIDNYTPQKDEPIKSKPTAISHTQNVDDSGRRNTGYSSGWGNGNIVGTGKNNNSDAHVVCMSDVDYLMVDIYYSSNSSNYDIVSVYSGSNSYYYFNYDYDGYLKYALPGADRLGGSGSGTYNINGNTVTNVNYKQILVPSSCVTFTFYSRNDGTNYYGYYAKITGEKLSNGKNKKLATKYSYTNNLTQDGEKVSNYGENWGNSNVIGSTRGDTNYAHVVTIPNANVLLVDVFYNSESDDTDWMSVWSGSCSSCTATRDYNNSVSKKLGGPQYGNYKINGNLLTNVGHKQFIISGNTATFSFTSDGALSGDGYGYYAIITGYGNTNNVVTTTKQATVQESICPKGWRLPHVQNASNNEFSKLLPDGNYTDAAKRRFFTNQPLFYTDTEAPINYINDNSIEPLVSTLSNAYSHDDTSAGFVRCVAEETYPFSITFVTNDALATAPSTVHALFTDTNPKQIMVPVTDISYPGNKFLGWTSDPESDVVEYVPGTYYSFDSSAVQLYAVWHPIDTFEEAFELDGKAMVDGEHYAMQDMNERICGLLPAYNGNLITGTLIDTRDNKLYNVAKLKDNHCWMIQDLAFITGDEVTLNPSTSNVSSEMGANIAPIENENGVYYTYEAATVGFGRGLKTLMTGDNVSNMNIKNNPADGMNSICPKGWSLPNAFGYYSYPTLINEYEEDLSALNADFAPNLHGVWDTNANTFASTDTLSGYWTPKLAQLGKSFSMSFGNNETTVVTASRDYAMNIRCIAVDNPNSIKTKPSLYNLGTMQGITPEIINNTSNGSFAVDVIDERDDGKEDRPVYTVMKQNGRIWMTSSLRYEHEDGAILSPYTSDVPAEIAFTAEGNSYYVATPHNMYYSEHGTELAEREETARYVGEEYNYGGEIYEFNSATMGYYYSYDYATVNNTDGSSICPAGWQLPENEMIAQYISSANYPTYNTNYDTTGVRYSYPLLLNLGGYYTGAQGEEYTAPEHAGNEGFFWSSTRISNRNSRGLWFSPNAIDSAYPMARNVAAQVRCVSK